MKDDDNSALNSPKIQQEVVQVDHMDPTQAKEDNLTLSRPFGPWMLVKRPKRKNLVVHNNNQNAQGLKQDVGSRFQLLQDAEKETP
ncbi:DUF814-domain-containing protein [Sesbania bispinosa]|nr:DUF814-domain-containing protein [Sesbania bispinosa]